MSKQFAVGDKVSTPKGKGEVVSFKSGWYEVALDDGSQKFRAKDLALLTPYNMSEHIRRYRERYQRSASVAGNKSLNNGDDLALFLEMKSEIDVMKLADQFAPFGPKHKNHGKSHAEAYDRLNNGQKRMNAGNKLRALWKKGELALEDGKLVAVDAG